MTTLQDELDAARERWSLTAVEPPFATATALLQKVRGPRGAAMLKVTHSPQEQRGYDLLAWWNGQGAVELFAHSGPAILMDQSEGGTILKISSAGDDTRATDIFLNTRAALHQMRERPLPPSLIPIEQLFEALAQCPETALAAYFPRAQRLLAQPSDRVPLHGDLHHDNIMYFGVDDWRAIDPKGFFGNPLFDLGAFFLNPDAADLSVSIARNKTIFDRRLVRVTRHLKVPQEMIAQWISVTAALAGAWAVQDGFDPALALDVARLADGHCGEENT